MTNMIKMRMRFPDREVLENENEVTVNKTTMITSHDIAVSQGKKPCSSPPFLLMSSMDQRAESSNEGHRRLVERVEQALKEGLGSSRPMNHSGSDSENSDEDSAMEDSEDDRTLWELQKGLRKESRARKGVQILSSVQKKSRKITKGKGG
ncbi:hypothetical protein J5N97_028639 [Dioscorea zingiberensis]|uniref:Uncharacterized protein n=1 Tax=Dioscorea zingiberensis TaxID=325984 RepID=A0A9D5BYU1_9LILI|nr:hypothetical protein J5N97_028639 [Dioscorea zingiberensis]